MTDIHFKRGSTLPVYTVKLCRPDAETQPLPLAGASVRLLARSKYSSDIILDQILEVIDVATAECQLTRTKDDFPQCADCRAEIIVTFGNGDVLIMPGTGYYNLVIEESLI